MMYDNGKWTTFDSEAAIALVGDAQAYHNVTDVVQDPADPNHHWIGTKRSGIYEFQDFKAVKYYGYNNSPITSILPESSHPDWYTRVTALNIDPQGNLWMMNNLCDTIVRIRTELVRGLTIVGIVSCYKVLGQIIGRICGERCQQDNALCKGSIKTFHGQDTVHTIYTEESRLITHTLCLLQDQGCRLIIDR